MLADPYPPRQYYLSRTAPNHVPPGYTHLRYGKWHVVLDSEFTVRSVVVGDTRVGCVFGTILDTVTPGNDGEILLEDVSGGSIARSFERALADLVGRYVGLVDVGGRWRLYTDASGALPAVYHADRELVSASPAAIPDLDHEKRFRADLYEAVIEHRSSSWIPGSVTYYSGVSRLLPNHYLDLQAFEPRRFWPRSEPTVGADPTAEIETIRSTLRQVFSCINATYDTPELALTAGKDSRSLLAVARPLASDGRITLFTLDRGPNDVDMHVARRIAAEQGLEWRPLPVVEATEEQRRQWLQRTGYTVRSAIMRSHPSLRNLDGDVRIEGLGGEIGRAFYWAADDSRETEVDAATLLDRFGKPQHSALVDTVETWLDGCTEFDTYTQLDLAYQEHRLGCWAGPQHLGLPPDMAYVCPFFHRSAIEAMHRLPPETRRSDDLGSQIVERAWPALNEHPYNTFTGWRKYWNRAHDGLSLVSTAVTHPTRTARYLERKATGIIGRHRRL